MTQPTTTGRSQFDPERVPASERYPCNGWCSSVVGMPPYIDLLDLNLKGGTGDLTAILTLVNAVANVLQVVA